jgi:hypothetical protein
LTPSAFLMSSDVHGFGIVFISITHFRGHSADKTPLYNRAVR